MLYVGGILHTEKYGICFGSYRPQVHRHRLATLKQNLLPYTTHTHRATHLTHTYVCTCIHGRGCCLCRYPRLWDPGEPPAHLEMGLGLRCQQRGAGELLEDFGEARSGLLIPQGSPTAQPPVALPAAPGHQALLPGGDCWQCSCPPAGQSAWTPFLQEPEAAWPPGPLQATREKPGREAPKGLATAPALS